MRSDIEQMNAQVLGASQSSNDTRMESLEVENKSLYSTNLCLLVAHFLYYRNVLNKWLAKLLG